MERSTMKIKKIRMILGCIIGISGLQAGAASITWDAPVYISSNDTDVIKLGGRFAAEQTGNTIPVTINGVTFRGRGGSENILYSSGRTYGSDAICPSTNSNPLVSDEYRTMLRALSWDQDNGGVYTVTITNLTPGTQYKVQIWCSSADQLADAALMTWSDGTNNSDPLDVGRGAPYGLGMYVIGSFTADSTGAQAVLGTTTDGNPIINGIQVRDMSLPDGTDDEDYIPPPPVPGPASITWEAPQDIVDASDVRINGTLFAAESMGYDGPVTVNGVLFGNPGSSSNVTLSAEASQYSGDGITAPGTFPEPEYDTLLHGVTWDDAGFYSILLTNLTIGSTYQVQIWMHSASADSPEQAFTVDADTGVTNRVVAHSNTGSGIGQYVVGEFTATAYQQMIGMDKNPDYVGATSGKPFFNAFQVRELGWVPANEYQAWMATYGLTNSAPDADDDSDGADNLYEYALNGDPTNAANAGVNPTIESDGSGISYVYLKRDDTNLTYTLSIKRDLVYDSWTNSGYSVTTESIDPTWSAVTNTPLAPNSEVFFKLEIKQQ